MAVRSKLAKPLTVVLVVAVIVVVIVVTWAFYRAAKAKIEESAIEKISTIAAMIEPSTIQSLNGDMSDLENETYIETKAAFGDIVEVNDEFVFLYLMGVNKNNKTFFYIDSDDSDDQALPGEIYDDTTSKMWKTIETGQSQFDDLYDGEDTDEWGTWISAYAPIKDADGKFVALLGVDIDQDKYVADIVIQTSPPVLVGLAFAGIVLFYRRSTKKVLQQVEREKELLSVASHEVRSPLISIKWVLDDMLQRSDDLPEAARDTITAVNHNAAKVIDSINGILSSTPSWGSGHIGDDKIEMRQLFEDISETLSLVAKEHRITIHIGDSVKEGITVRGDKSNLNHAFYNIVNNALKYAYPDTEIVIKHALVGKYHRFSVSDHGPGVKPEDRDKIFEGLYRTSEAVASKQPGTGLGLYFVKKIIADHRGKIYVDPNYTDGTTFVVELPE